MHKLKLGMLLMLMLTTQSVFSAAIEKIEINGYLSVEYEKTIAGDAEGDVNGSFDMDLFDLVFNIQATDRLRITTDITFEHGAATEDGRGNVAVEYAFAEYTRKNWLRFRAGKMFTAFGIYNEIHTAKPATLSVKEPLSTNKNNKFGSAIRFYPRWLTGLAIQGDTAIAGRYLDYIIQFSNGETEGDSNPFEEDDNSTMAVNGRVRLQLSDRLSLGVSHYRDKMDVYSGGVSIDRIVIHSYGYQIEYESNAGLGIEVEHVGGMEGDIERHAYTVMLSQHVGKGLIAYFRNEYLEPDASIDNDEARRDILGLNIEVDSNMFIKVELVDNTTAINNSKYSGADWTEVKASLSVGF